MLKPKTSNVVLKLKIIMLRFKATEVVQEAGSLVIRIMLKPTRLLY
jgi:hypothetical protein